MESYISKIKNKQLTDLEKKYFSQENIDHINEHLVNYVHQKTNGRVKIDKQSNESIIHPMILMMDHMTENRQIDNHDIKHLEALNEAIKKQLEEHILKNVYHHVHYITKKSNRNQDPIPLPESTKYFRGQINNKMSHAHGI